MQQRKYKTFNLSSVHTSCCQQLLWSCSMLCAKWRKTDRHKQMDVIIIKVPFPQCMTGFANVSCLWLLYIASRYVVFMTCSSVSIESWILPMAYAGHVNAVAWLTPFWTDHSFPAESNFQVGKDSETQQIR